MYGTVVSSCPYDISGTGEVVTPGATQLPGYHYPITTNASYSSQQSNVQPQSIMQMQQPVLQAQQAGIPTAMQAQNPVMPVQQATGMQMQQPISMMTIPQSLMSVQQQTVMPPTHCTWISIILLIYHNNSKKISHLRSDGRIWRERDEM